MARMRAKFRCGSVKQLEGPQEQVEMSAVVADDNMENQDFNKASPSGDLEIWIDNPTAHGYFVPGKEYYLDFTPVEPDQPPQEA